MRIGLGLPHYGTFAEPEAIVQVARAAEEMGYDSLWTGDRILSPVEPSDPYPSGDGVMPHQFATYLDPLGALTFAAAATERIRLGTSTLNALWHSPVLLARSLTTLDVLSGGRLEAGFGLGWLRDEFTAAGVPWHERGARFDETLDVLEKIWAGDVVAHEGRFFSVPRSTILPKPVQRPRPPILLGAFTPPGLRRVGRRADGWLAAGMPLPHLTGLWRTVLRHAADAGRDPSALRMVLRVNAHLSEEPADPAKVPAAGTLAQVAGYARAAAEAGVHELFVDLGLTTTTAAQVVDVAGRFVESVRGQR
jgi:probable F420-dependent oxidoreductase